MKKIEEYEQQSQEGIKLNANELFYDKTSDFKLEWLIEICTKIDYNRYPDATNSKIINAYANAMELDPKMILAGNGSDEMLGFLIGTYLGKDKTLLTIDPDFSMYDYYCSMYDADIKKYKTNNDGSFEMDDFIQFALDLKPQMILFSNPNNPTGHAVSNQDLIKLVETFKDIPVVIDEAYSEFADETMIYHVKEYKNLFVTRTLSKAYGLAAVRIGFLVGHIDVISPLRGQVVPYNVNTFSQTIGSVILRHAEEYKPLIETIKQSRDALYNELKQLENIEIYPSQANYLFGRVHNKPLLLQLFEEKGIVIRNYAHNDSFRITIGSEEQNQMVVEVFKAYNEEVTK